MPPELMFCVLPAIAITILVIYSGRRYKLLTDLQRELQTLEPLFNLANYELITDITIINGARVTHGKHLLAITLNDIIIQPFTRRSDARITLPKESLRWFGRPVKYHEQRNELWLHFEYQGTWWLVRFSAWPYTIKNIVRALKDIAPAELNTAYRRHRPYVHAGPVSAAPATQDIYGAWTLTPRISLYLMPLHLVVLEGQRIIRTYPIHQIQTITARRRLDAPDAEGLVTFAFNGEFIAFAMRDFESFAASIGEAARRSLEEPVYQKQKKKYGESEDSDLDE